MFLTRTTIQLLLFSFTLLSVAPLLADEPLAEDSPEFTLRYKFKQGEAFGYHVKSFDRNTAQRAEFSQTILNRNDYQNQISVIEINEDGSAVLEVQINQAVMETKFDDDPTITFDSSDPEKQPAKFWEIKENLGKPTSRAVISSTGTLESIQNLRPDLNSPDRPLDPPKQETSQNFLVKLPEESVKVGESWYEDYEIMVKVAGSPSIPVKMRRTFQLAQVSGDIAKITMKTAALTPINDPQMEASMIQQTPTCLIEFDMQAGQVQKRNWKVEKVVIGGFGPNSSYKVVSLRQDELLPAIPQVASQDSSSVR